MGTNEFLFDPSQSLYDLRNMGTNEFLFDPSQSLYDLRKKKKQDDCEMTLHAPFEETAV